MNWNDLFTDPAIIEALKAIFLAIVGFFFGHKVAKRKVQM